MRLVGLLLMILGSAIVYELAYKGRNVRDAIAEVGGLFGLRQIANASSPTPPAPGGGETFA